MAFANVVADIAEAEGHHPDLYVAWGQCRVEVWTHKIKGLTESDFYFAAKADRALNELDAQSLGGKGTMSEFTTVARIEDLASGECKSVEVAGSRIALFNVAGQFYAMDDTCLHRGGPLGEGTLEDTIVTCPWHGWQYDVSTGACQTNPRAQLNCYDVRVEGDEVQVSLE